MNRRQFLQRTGAASLLTLVPVLWTETVVKKEFVDLDPPMTATEVLSLREAYVRAAAIAINDKVDALMVSALV